MTSLPKSGLLVVDVVENLSMHQLKKQLQVQDFIIQEMSALVDIKNDVDFDKKIPVYIFQSCSNCGKFVRTKNKTKLILFMYDHYGMDGIRKCNGTWYGEFVYTLLNWRYRNY
jgi:hypothetical protein